MNTDVNTNGTFSETGGEVDGFCDRIIDEDDDSSALGLAIDLLLTASAFL